MTGFKFSKKNTGFTLVETLVSVSIFSLAVITGMSVLGQGLSDINYAKKKIVATYLGQEGIEAMRNVRDSYVLYTSETGKGWSNFRAKIAQCNQGSPCGVDITQSVFDNSFVFKCSQHQGSCDLYIDSSGHYNTNLLGSPSGYNRIVWFDTSINNEIKVYSRVYWSQGSGTYHVDFTQTLFNWVE